MENISGGLEGFRDIILGIQSFIEDTPGLKEAKTEEEFLRIAKEEISRLAKEDGQTGRIK